MSLLEVGKIDKPHGLKGEVVVTLTTTESVRVAPGSVLITADGRELVVASSTPHQHRWIVGFEGFARREDAEPVVGAVLRAEPLDDDDPDALWVHELVGAEVSEADGTVRGRVESVLENPASDLLVLDTGALVPLTFVVRHQADQVVVDVPAGLFDLLEE